MLNQGMLSSNKEDWETPNVFFNKLNNKYHFSFDLASNDNNHKVSNYYTIKDDALSKPWHNISGNLWLNPPYGRQIKIWVKKAYEESLLKQSGHIILLIPARTDTSYWHDYIFGKAQIHFLRGRLKFEINGKPKDAAPFPSALVIY